MRNPDILVGSILAAIIIIAVAIQCPNFDCIDTWLQSTITGLILGEPKTGR